jgi:hypothetical protein
MEVDAAGPTAEAQEPVALPTFTVNVLQTVQSSQTIHGLKHSDYLRYRWATGLHMARSVAS